VARRYGIKKGEPQVEKKEKPAGKLGGGKRPKGLEELRRYALEIGSDRALVLPTRDLVIRESARAKCYIPACKFYGSSIMCPPHNPLTPEVTRKIAADHQYGILFQLDVPVEDFVGEEWRKRHVPAELRHKEIVAKLEGKAFYMGFPRAMGFAAGECSLCLPGKTCAVLEGAACAHPLRARPAMEACGFDVFAIAKKAGWNLVPVGHSSTPQQVSCASLIGLVLVD
jgi:predicted metal-binding protein